MLILGYNEHMLTQEELKNILKQDRYKERIQKLDSETLHIIVSNPSKAEEYARKNIDKSIPDDQKDEYIQMMVKSMKELAKIILEKRSKLK